MIMLDNHRWKKLGNIWNLKHNWRVRAQAIGISREKWMSNAQTQSNGVSRNVKDRAYKIPSLEENVYHRLNRNGIEFAAWFIKLMGRPMALFSIHIRNFSILFIIARGHIFPSAAIQSLNKLYHYYGNLWYIKNLLDIKDIRLCRIKCTLMYVDVRVCVCA